MICYPGLDCLLMWLVIGLWGVAGLMVIAALVLFFMER